jgi:hypothetical protein
MASATTGPSGGTRGHRVEGCGWGLVRFACVLLVVMGALATAVCLRAGALMVQLIRVFLATPGPARGPAPHPAGLTEVHACGGSARSWPPAGVGSM